MKIGIERRQLHTFEREFLKGVTSYIGCTENSPEIILAYPVYSDHFLEEYLDAIIRFTGDYSQENSLIPLSRAKPEILLFKDQRQLLIDIAYKEIGRMGANFFLEQGFKNIAFCCIDTDQSPNTKKCVDEFSSEIKNTTLTGVTAHTHLYTTGKKFLQWINQQPKPMAIVFNSDALAEKALQVCLLNRIAVPDEVSILGVGNDELICNLVTPQISSIDISADRLGFEAVRQLHSISQKEAAPGSFPLKVLPRFIVERTSTTYYGGVNPILKKGIEHIEQNYKSRLKVNTICDVCSISRRSLEKYFLEELGATILTTIRKVKIKHAQKMLAYTNLTPDEIADKLNAGSTRNFCRTFTAFKGMTPVQYRNMFNKVR